MAARKIPTCSIETRVAKAARALAGRREFPVAVLLPHANL